MIKLFIIFFGFIGFVSSQAGNAKLTSFYLSSKSRPTPVPVNETNLTRLIENINSWFVFSLIRFFLLRSGFDPKKRTIITLHGFKPSHKNDPIIQDPEKFFTTVWY